MPVAKAPPLSQNPLFLVSHLTQTRKDLLDLIFEYLLNFPTKEQGGFLFFRESDSHWRWLPVPSQINKAALYEPSDDMSEAFAIEDAGYVRVGSVHNHPFWAALPSITDADNLFKDHVINLIFSNKNMDYAFFDRGSKRITQFEAEASTAPRTNRKGGRPDHRDSCRCLDCGQSALFYGSEIEAGKIHK